MFSQHTKLSQPHSKTLKVHAFDYRDPLQSECHCAVLC